jgi:hypothetical protein
MTAICWRSFALPVRLGIILAPPRAKGMSEGANATGGPPPARRRIISSIAIFSCRVFVTANDGLKGLQDGGIDAFVYNKPLMSWIILQNSSSSLRVGHLIRRSELRNRLPKGKRLTPLSTTAFSRTSRTSGGGKRCFSIWARGRLGVDSADSARVQASLSDAFAPPISGSAGRIAARRCSTARSIRAGFRAWISCRHSFHKSRRSCRRP